MRNKRKFTRCDASRRSRRSDRNVTHTRREPGPAPLGEPQARPARRRIPVALPARSHPAVRPGIRDRPDEAAGPQAPADSHLRLVSGEKDRREADGISSAISTCPSDDALIAPFVKRLSRHVVTVVSEATVGKEPANRTPAETAAFERLMATKTFAVKDAPPAEGRFPVVINHPGLGGVADDNSVLFELWPVTATWC